MGITHVIFARIALHRRGATPRGAHNHAQLSYFLRQLTHHHVFHFGTYACFCKLFKATQDNFLGERSYNQTLSQWRLL